MESKSFSQSTDDILDLNNDDLDFDLDFLMADEERAEEERKKLEAEEKERAEEERKKKIETEKKMAETRRAECYKMAQGAEPLTGINYKDWSMTMKVVIEVAGAGAVIAPNFDVTKDVDKLDYLVYQLLVLSVNSDLKSNLIEGKGRESWDALKEFCHPDSIGVQLRVFSEIVQCKLLPGGDMRQHVSKLMRLFNEINQAGFAEFSPKLQTMILLTSVPESYNQLITVIGTWKESEASMQTVKSKLIEEYDKQSRRAEHAEADMALRVSATSRLGPKPNRKPYNPAFETRICRACNRKGHIEINCQSKKITKNVIF